MIFWMIFSPMMAKSVDGETAGEDWSCIRQLFILPGWWAAAGTMSKACTGVTGE
jgi:hypothetical protein